MLIRMLRLLLLCLGLLIVTGILSAASVRHEVVRCLLLSVIEIARIAQFFIASVVTVARWPTLVRQIGRGGGGG